MGTIISLGKHNTQNHMIFIIDLFNRPYLKTELFNEWHNVTGRDSFVFNKKIPA